MSEQFFATLKEIFGNENGEVVVKELEQRGLTDPAKITAIERPDLELTAIFESIPELKNQALTIANAILKTIESS